VLTEGFSHSRDLKISGWWKVKDQNLHSNDSNDWWEICNLKINADMRSLNVVPSSASIRTVRFVAISLANSCGDNKRYVFIRTSS
jgi:hypothetical protein